MDKNLKIRICNPLKFVLLILPFLTSVACTSTPPPAPQTQGYSVFAEGQNSGFTLEKTMIIETTKEFGQWWAIHTGSRQTPVPIIDFNNKIVVAAFLGEQRTGGYSISMAKLVETDQQVLISLSIKRPIPGQMHTMQITQPFIMFTLNKTTKPVNFEYNKEP